MESITLFGWVERKLENTYLPNQPARSHLKKYFIAGSLVALSLMIFMLLTFWILSIDILIQYALWGIALFSLTLPAPFFTKKLEHIILIQKTVTILVTVYFSYKMGGVLNSGGIILIGIGAVAHTVIFKNYRWRLLVFLVFIFSIFTLYVLSNNALSATILTQRENLLIFSFTLVGITGYIFIFTNYAVYLYSQLEKKEVSRQKEMNEAKTRLYTNITHEFRTPLTVILGLVDSLRNNGQSNRDGIYDTITRNGNKLLELVDQLMDLSKLESGKLNINTIHGNIVPFLRYTFQLQEQTAIEKNLEFYFVSESQSYSLDFDPEKISMIVSNLLSNAIKFTPPGGKIIMNVKGANSHLIIEIIDNGIGIPANKQSKIFDRFYQVDDNSTRKNGGAGIGLAITKELVSLLDGNIDVCSIPNQETKFTITLPIKTIKSNGFEKLDNLPVRIYSKPDREIFHLEKKSEFKNKQRLLIVEDNKDVVQYLAACYQQSFNIDFALTGKQGYELALQRIPDIIISDVMMPEMDGFEMCKKLKNDIRTSHIPIILLTAKADLYSRIEGLEKGADAYLSKPFSQQELFVQIRNLLELRTKLQKRYSNGINYLSDPTNPQIRLEDKFFELLTKTIENNLSNENYNVHTLCREIGMSKSQLYRKFKALTNESIARYIRKIRMEKARYLLESTSMNVSEVGDQIGMKNLSTFSRQFKEEYGESPSLFSDHFN